jgi:hypothetical protein
VQEDFMRTWLRIPLLAYLPIAATAQSTHTLQLINDTHSSIVSFWIAPAGSRAWTRIDFTELRFDSGWAYIIGLKDDQDCLRDFRTLLSDGETVRAKDFDICRLHAYQVGIPFRRGHQGRVVVPW